MRTWGATTLPDVGNLVAWGLVELPPGRRRWKTIRCILTMMLNPSRRESWYFIEVPNPHEVLIGTAVLCNSGRRDPPRSGSDPLLSCEDDGDL